MEDWQLLADYARTGSEAAFARLVERHLGLVHAAARRQVQDDALAADVAQAVFLLLARKAGSLGPKSVLVGWLFRTTRLVATNALRSEVRRQRREQEAVAMQELHTSDPHWNRLAPELDEAIARLGETDRNALLLRFAEGRNHREVGVALGLSEDAAKKRVNRALEKLRGTLVGHGATLTLVVLAGLLADRLSAAPPAGLAAGITQGVAAGVAPAGVAAGLVQQAVAAWRWAQVKFAAACVGTVVLVAALFWVPQSLLDRGVLPPAPVAQAAAATNPPAAPVHVAGVPPRLNGTETFRLQVIAADTGEPLPGTRVLLNFVSNDEWIAPNDRETDAQGTCVIPLPRGALMRLDAGAHFPGYENRFFTWRSDWQHPRPDGYVLKLGRAETVGGQVVDEARRPLAGVSVWLACHVGDTSWREPAEDRERMGFMRRFPLGTTDDAGRWACSTISAKQETFSFEFEHPDYVKNEDVYAGRGDESAVGREILKLLQAGKMVTVMKSGSVVFGQVVNTAGEPIGGTRIGKAWHEPAATTDSTGQFTVRSMPKGEVSFTATADGYAPKWFRAVAGGGAVRVQLEPGGVLRARIVSTNGEPIWGASLVLDGGFGDGELGWDGKTDENGRVEWRGAPPGRALNFTAYAAGHRYLRRVGLTVDGTEHILTLHPKLEVVGSVTDAQSGQPIARFKAIPGEGREYPNFDRSELHYGTDGSYQLHFDEMGAPVVRIEAEGYDTELGYPQPGPEGEPRCDFKLQRTDPKGGVHGLVLNPDGSPAVGAEVALCTLETSAQLGRGRFLRRDGSMVTNTDAAGRFVFPVVRKPHTVAAVSGGGFARTLTRGGEPLELRLRPFGTIEGLVIRNGQPQADKMVVLQDAAFLYFQAGCVFPDLPSFQVKTDAAGRFRLGQVPAGEFRLYVNPGRAQMFSDETAVSVVPGQVASVVVGEPDPAGCTVTGRLKMSERLPVEEWYNWEENTTTRTLGLRLPKAEPPANLSEEDRRLWWFRWIESEVGQEQLRQSRSYPLEVAPDGTFRARGVLPGEYQLNVAVLPVPLAWKDPLARTAAVWQGRITQTVVITERDPASPEAPLDLGEMEMKIQRRKTD